MLVKIWHTYSCTIPNKGWCIQKKFFFNLVLIYKVDISDKVDDVDCVEEHPKKIMTELRYFPQKTQTEEIATENPMPIISSETAGKGCIS